MLTITATLDSGTTNLDTNNASASISVFDKDLPTLSIVESSVRATEGQPFEITIMADPAPVENLTINLTISAPSGNPFTFSPNPIVLSASSTSTTVVVTAEDVSDDITHRIRIEESIRYNSSLTDLLSVLILDNDNPIASRPNVSISEVAASVAEGSPALFTISLDPATISRIVTDGSGPPTTETIPNTAIVSLNISDVNSALGTGVQTTQNITVRGTGTFEVPTRSPNATTDGTSSITVAIVDGAGGTGTNYRIADNPDNTATVSVTDESRPVFTISSATPTVNEGESITFTVAVTPADTTLDYQFSISETGNFVVPSRIGRFTKYAGSGRYNQITVNTKAANSIFETDSIVTVQLIPDTTGIESRWFNPNPSTICYW